MWNKLEYRVDVARVLGDHIQHLRMKLFSTEKMCKLLFTLISYPRFRHVYLIKYRLKDVVFFLNTLYYVLLALKVRWEVELGYNNNLRYITKSVSKMHH